MKKLHTAFLIALVSLAAAGTLPVGGQEREQNVTEEITVFEAQVTIDASDLGLIDRQKLRPDQILLLEGGVPRRVTNLESLGSGAWRLLLYFDAPTSRARTVKLAAQRLGSLAQQLTDLGAVEVVVADPEPRTVLTSSHQATPLADRLAQIASSGIGGDQIKALRDEFEAKEPALAPTDPQRAEALGREVALVRDQVDRLILRAAEGCGAEPCALFLVSDGFFEDPASFYLGEHRLAGIGEIDPIEEASQELAQTVAGYEWIAFALPLREGRIETPVVARPRTDFDVFLDHTGAVQRAPKASDREPALDWEKLEVSVTPVLQPLLRVAVGSDGQVLRVVDDVEKSLETLPTRRRLYYLTDRPLDGDPRTISARMVGSGAELGTPAWVRSSTPVAVAGARVRALLEGRKLDGAVPLEARIERGAEGQASLSIETRWEQGKAPLPQSPIRVSVGYLRLGELPWVGHQRVRTGEIAEGVAWRHRLALPLPAGVDRLAVVVEALGPRAWAATVVEPQP